MFKQVFLPVLLLLPVEAVALNAAGPEAPEAGSRLLAYDEDEPVRRKKRRGKKRGRNKARQWAQDGAARSDWLPDWPASSFNWGLQPIVGFRRTVDDGADGKTTTDTSELGLSLGLKHIPIVPGNPGFNLSLEPGYTTGTININDPKTDGGFSRKFGSLGLEMLYSWLRYQLRFIGAHLEYNGDFSGGSRSLRIINEPAILLKPRWSLHLTISFYNLWQTRYDDPEALEWDVWLHTRKSFRLLSSFIDFGPGVTRMDQKNSDGRKVSATTRYLLGVGGAHLFWKLGANLRLKYTYDTGGDADDRFANLLIPDQDVTDPTVLATQPEDSMEITAFLGGRRLIGGLGLGWQYHQLTVNYTEKNGERRSVVDQGWVVSYELAL